MANLDIMICAHALAIGAVLVTNDRAFTRIRNLKVADCKRRRRSPDATESTYRYLRIKVCRSLFVQEYLFVR